MDIGSDKFSGGITDEVVGSNPSRFYRGDNLLINRDEQPFSRPGSASLNAGIGTSTEEVGGLINYQFDVQLFRLRGRSITYQDPSSYYGWTHVGDYVGANAFSSATDSSRYNSAEWRGHLYISESNHSYPVKVYQDNTNTWVLAQVGAPVYAPVAAYSGDVPSNFVDLANNLYSYLRFHFNLSGYHVVEDLAGFNTLGTYSPLAYGCSLADLIVLTNALAKAYTAHITDARRTNGGTYHSKSGGDYVAGPNIFLDNTIAPETLDQVASVLNDIKLKFNWHARGFRLHSGITTVPTASIPLAESGPIFGNGASTPTSSVPGNLTNLISSANLIKSQFNAHISSTVAHSTAGWGTNGDSAFANLADTSNTISLADCTDYDSLRELTMHLSLAYTNHQTDAGYAVHRVSGYFLDAFDWLCDRISPASTAPIGDPTQLVAGMYVYPTVAPGASNQWSIGSYIVTYIKNGTSSNPTWYQAALNTSNDKNGANAETRDYFFSKKKYHRAASYQETHASATLITDYTVDLIQSNFSILYAALFDIWDKFDYHALSGYYHSLGFDLMGSHSTLPSSITPYSYKYSFVWTHSYTLSNGELFKEVGEVYEKIYTPFDSIENLPNTITGFTAHANTSSENYNDSALTLEIYRTINGGSTSYLVGTVSNYGLTASTTFTDTVSDSDLTAGAQLYTADGTVPRTPAPRCKYLHSVNNLMYYGHIIDESGAVCPNRIRQSFIDSPGASPGDFFAELPKEVTGVSSARDVPVAFTQSGVYRLSGSVSETGSGSIDVVPVSENIGLLCPYSLVKIEEGLVFAGTDGFYFTDGFRLQKLNQHWGKRYQNLIATAQKQRNMTGAYDRQNRRVWWAVTENNELVNDSCYILDLEFGLKDDACFTTASGGSSFAPTSLSFWRGNLVRGHQYGWVLNHDPAYTADPIISLTTGTNPSDWNTQPVVYDYLSTAYDAGVGTVRKRATLLVSHFNNLGHVSVQPYVVDDLGRSRKNLTPIRYRGGLVWGDPQIVWGDPQYVWDAQGGTIDEKRHVSGTAINFAYRQIGFTNADVNIATSDVYGKATLDRVAKTLTINSSTLSWPNSVYGFTVSFENDEYVLEFTINARTNTVLDLTDATGLLPANGSYAWVIRGVPKNEFFQLLSYSMPVVMMGNSQKDASGESGGIGT